MTVLLFFAFVVVLHWSQPSSHLQQCSITSLKLIYIKTISGWFTLYARLRFALLLAYLLLTSAVWVKVTGSHMCIKYNQESWSTWNPSEEDSSFHREGNCKAVWIFNQHLNQKMGTIRRVWKCDELLTFSSLSLWELSANEREREREWENGSEREWDRERMRKRDKERENISEVDEVLQRQTHFFPVQIWLK